jgi:hypothetical protein
LGLSYSANGEASQYHAYYGDCSASHLHSPAIHARITTVGIPSRAIVIGILRRITHVPVWRILQKNAPPGLSLKSRKHFIDHSDCSGSNEHNEYAGENE